jgi:CRISPR/Cas system-associated exonuclease Cas4 (RecB family)
MRRRSLIISASEVSRFVYCQRAWWLSRIAGCEPANTEALNAGANGHREHGRTVRSALLWQRLGLALIALGAVAAVAALVVALAAGAG